MATKPEELQEFGAEARRAVSSAEVEARELGHDRVGTEHLLLGLLATRPSGAATLLTDTGTTLAAARSKVSEAVGARRGVARVTGPLARTPRAIRALGRSVRFCHARSAEVVSSEHLLWGVLDVEGTAGQVLRGLGVDIEQLRASLEALESPPVPDRESSPALERDLVAARSATCPHCSASVNELTFRSVTAYDADRNMRDALVFSCATCGNVLGVASVGVGNQVGMDIIRNDDGSLTVPVAPDRDADENAEAPSAPETLTLRPGEGGYNEALAEWDQQQDPSRAEPVSTPSGRESAMAVVHAVAEDPEHVAEAIDALDDPEASADALRHVLVGGTPAVHAFASEVAEAEGGDALPPHQATKIIGEVLAEIDTNA